MTDLNHLSQSVLLRQTGELAPPQADELEALLQGHPAAAAYAREAAALQEAYKSAAPPVPPTPALSLERILREGQRQAKRARPWSERFAPAMGWAAAVAALLVSAAAIAFFLRPPAPGTELAAATVPAPLPPASAGWERIESDGFETQLALLDARLQAVKGTEEAAGVDEDTLALELLLWEAGAL
jgi:anti-sigma factor RsiW